MASVSFRSLCFAPGDSTWTYFKVLPFCTCPLLWILGFLLRFYCYLICKTNTPKPTPPFCKLLFACFLSLSWRTKQEGKDVQMYESANKKQMETIKGEI